MPYRWGGGPALMRRLLKHDFQRGGVPGGIAEIRHQAAVQAAARAFDDLATSEPALRASIAPTEIADLPFTMGQDKGRRYAAWRKLFRSFSRTYDRMIFVSRLTGGRATAAALNALRAAQQRHGAASTLLVVTDRAILPICCALPAGTHIRVLPELDPLLQFDRRVGLAVTLIHHLQPKAVLNVGSAVLWKALADYGAALAMVTEHYAFLCPSVFTGGRLGRRESHSLSACLPHLARIYVDDPSLARNLIGEHGGQSPLAERLSLLPASERKGQPAFRDAFVRSLAQAPSFLG
jgi:hypothetical protein